MGLSAQNLKKHQWIYRLILIISSDLKSEIYTSQIKEFKTSAKAFNERKLLTYYVLPKSYRHGNSSDNKWLDGSELYTTYNPSNSNFKVILIGLDGRPKVEQSELLTSKELFSIIDGMPMRRSEIKNTP